MELRPVTGGALRDWYDRELTQAFPPNERKPLPNILALIDQRRYEVWGLFDGETLLGYATLWMEPGDKSCILLDYLGVTAARRNGGLGSQIVRMLAERLAGKSLLLIEAERPVEGDDPAENALRRRRLAFYERCGLIPAYDMATCGMRFTTFLPERPADPIRTACGASTRHRFGITSSGNPSSIWHCSGGILCCLANSIRRR